MVRYCIVGHGAFDHNIFEFDEDRFQEYNTNMSISEALNLSTTPLESENEICDYYDGNYGGPILTVGQWLAQRGDDVSAISVVGKDIMSDRYIDYLMKAGISTDKIRRYADVSLAQCVYVHDRHETMDPPLWEDDVTDKFKRLPLTSSLRDFLARHDSLVLPITEPLAAKRAAKTYIEERKDGFLAYIPGPYLTDGSVDFSRTYFRKILKLSNLLQLNEDEAEVVVNEFDLEDVENINQLFSLQEDDYDIAPRLEYLAVTLGSKGSKLYWLDKKSGEINEHCLSALSIEGSDVENFATSQGAGDAYSGVLIRSIMDNRRISSDFEKRKRIGAVQDAHRLAREAAAGMCKIMGALNRRVINAGSTDIAGDNETSDEE
ncbi:MAG: carbohydrate kinase family protein [Nanoarchaeota archaeon]|nr:carbohydrate kinase family protein [Nanoarchaeota archaeon]